MGPRPVFVGLACALSASTAGAAIAGKRPVLSAPLAKRPPTIDGRIAAGEWAEATACTGFSDLRDGLARPAQPVFFAAYSPAALYVAVRLPLPANSTPVAAVEQRDGPVYQDDSVEVFVAPVADGDEYFQFALNAAGTQRDAKGMDAAWTGSWRSATGRTGDAWEAEFAIPWACLGADSPPGEVGFNVAWNCRTGERGNYTWAPVSKSFHEPEHFGRLRLREGGPVLRFTHMRGWPSGRLHLGLALSGAGHDVACTLTGPDGAPIDPAGGGTRSFELPRDGELTRGGEYTLTYRCANVAEGQVRMLIPTALRLEAVRRMLAGEIDVTADLTGMGERARGTTLHLVLRNRQTGAASIAKELAVPDDPRLKQTLDLRTTASGLYDLTGTVRAPGGAVLASAELPVRRPQAPEWLNCREGVTDELLPPWTPVQVDGGIVRVWGREVDLSSGPLPRQIRTRDEDVLTGPVRLLCSSEGTEQRWRTGAPTFGEHTDADVTWAGTLNGPDVRVTVHGRMEYDGMGLLSIRVEPRTAGKRVTLSLEVPMRGPRATYLYHFPGQWRSAANIGALPEDGWAGPWKPYIWLGDEWRGLGWFCETDENWHPADRGKAVRVERRAEGTVLAFALLQDTLLTDPLEYVIGFQPTPVKPLKPDVWDYRIVHKGRYGLEKANHRPPGSATWPARGNVNPEQGTFECWVRPEFDPNLKVEDRGGRAQHNQNFLAIEFAKDRRACLYWNIDDRGMRAFVQTGQGQYPVLISTRNAWQRGQWHHVALTWGDELAVWVDGRKAGAKPHRGLLDDALDRAAIKLGFDTCAFLVDSLRTSDVARTRFDLSAPLEADGNTLLLEQFDHEPAPGEDRRTRPQKIAADCGAPGGLISPECGIVEGKWGRALALFTPGPPRSELDRLAEAGVRTICFHEHWTPIQNSHVPSNPEALRRLVKACHERGIQLLLYWGYEISNIHPDWDVYSAECLTHPRAGGYKRQPEQTAYIVCYQSAWQDYMAWSIAKIMDEFDIDGVYLDGTARPWRCANQHHGCGYLDTDGSRRSGYAVLATRDMMKRIYAIVKSRKPNGQVNVHNSLTMVTPSLAWATSTWDGEQFGGIERGPHFSDVVSLDAFRTEFMGQQWGVPAEFLCYGRPYTYAEALAFTLLHDVLVRPGDVSLASALWRTMDEFGRDRARWLPYWGNAEYVKAEPADVRVSLYSHHGKSAMLVVSNLGHEGTHARVSLDCRRLGLDPGEVTATKALDGRAAEVTAGVLELQLGPMGWQLIEVRGR